MIGDYDNLRDFSPAHGALYVSSFTNRYVSLAKNTANIIIQEMGPQPSIPRPPPAATIEESWD